MNKLAQRKSRVQPQGPQPESTLFCLGKHKEDEALQAGVEEEWHVTIAKQIYPRRTQA